VLAGQLGLIVLGRVGQDSAALSTMAETLLDRLLPAP
jgi:TetR/AcrR family transcriptional repressor of nem operon